MHIKRIQVAVIAGLLLLLPVLPQLVLADGPAISTPVVQERTYYAATIYWTTNTSSDSLVRYGTIKPPIQEKSDSTLVTTHSITLTVLSPGTTYYFEVESTDAFGLTTDDNSGAYYEFTTLSLPSTVYNITLRPDCGVCGFLLPAGVCGEVITATALVGTNGTYCISWDSLTNALVKFTAPVPGAYEVTFFLPQATKGFHNVYLVDAAYAQKASATFEVKPSATIAPETGPVGTNVTLNGYGFVAGQQIQVEFKGAVIQTTTATAVGNWTVTYTVPPTPAGGYTFDVYAMEGQLRASWVRKDFKVTPRITVTPSSGTVGKTIEIAGTGFASKEKDVVVTFDGKVLKGITYAEENGSWNVIIAVPPVQKGSHIIDASGASTRARDVPNVEFVVNPGILVEPISANVGDTITVKGGGFAPGETGIRIYFDQADVTPTTITTDMSGCWESSFTLPTSAHGSHIVSASGDITLPAVTNTVNTKARMLEISPTEGAPGDSISLYGDGFHASQGLTVSVGGVTASGDMTSQPNGNIGITFRVPRGTVEGQQEVWVTDEGGATGSTNLTVIAKTLPVIPLPISPKDSTLRSGMVTFRWQGMTVSTGYSYTLEITGEGSNLPKTTTESTYPLTQNEALGKGTYHWRVKVVDDYGNEGPWSESIEFRVSPIPPWVWVVVGLVVLIVLLVVAYRETKFRVTE
jgi:hypothetical protein